MNQQSQDQQSDAVPGLQALSMQRKPGDDLWPGIESRLKPRRSGLQAPRYLAAAACVLALLGGVVVLQLRDFSPPPASSTALVSAPPTQVALRVTPRRVPSAADTRGLIRTNLRVIESSDKQIRAAQKYDPDSRYLAALLQTNLKQREKLQQLLAQQQT